MSIEPTINQKRAFVVLGTAFMALAPVAVYARLGTVVLLVGTLVAQPRFGGAVEALRAYSCNTLVRLGAVFTLWAAVTLFWTPEPSVLALARTVLVPVMGLLLIAAVRDLPEDLAQRLAKLVMASGVVMLALLALEVFSHGALLRFAFPAPPGMAADQTPPVIEAAARGIAILGPLAFVYAGLIYAFTKRVILALVFVAAVITVGMFTSMDAGWVAVAAGAVVFALAMIAPRTALVLVFAGLMFYAALAPIISAKLVTVEALPPIGARAWLGVQTRVGIWEQAAGYIAEHPVVGHGFDATRVLSRTAPLIPGTPYPALPLHTHNGILQIWLELGLVGIAITVLMLGTAMRAMWPMTSRRIPLAISLATFTGTAVIFLVSFGVWQHWWMATWMIIAALLQLALRALPITAR